MREHYWGSTKWVVAFLMFSLAGGPRCAAQTVSNDDSNLPPPPPEQEQPEVLTRGPVHEAFAEPVNMHAQSSLIVPEEPPPNIEEIPPVEKPEGEQFVWAPGYWAWDADRNNYIWVSGCWRLAPPNRYWVTGYWAPVTGGWVWVGGFWAPLDVQEIEYLTAPPAVSYTQPSSVPPSSDSIWAPPCWYWSQGQYVLRPGYWLNAHLGWVWAPSHYIWTPRGYIFVPGHWDYPLEARGLLFAPVCFTRPFLYARSRFIYSPSTVVDVSLLIDNLFAYPYYRHYYFGDYYDDAYLQMGIYPWFDCARLFTWYDPIYEHCRWRFRQTEPRWEERIRNNHEICRADRNLRPPRTFHDMELRRARLPEAQRSRPQLVQPLTVVVAGRTPAMRFEIINSNTRRRIAREAAEAHGHPRMLVTSHKGPAISLVEQRSLLPSPQKAGVPEAPSAEPAHVDIQRAAPLATSPSTRLNAFSDFLSRTEVQRTLERARQSRQASATMVVQSPTPARDPERVQTPSREPERVHAPSHATKPARALSLVSERAKISPQVLEPKYTPPPPQPRAYTPQQPERASAPPPQTPAPPTVFHDATSRNEANSESSRGKNSMGTSRSSRRENR